MNPNYDKRTSVAFLGCEESSKLDPTDLHFSKFLVSIIRQLYKGGYRTFFTGLNEGFELIAADVVIMLKEQGELPDVHLFSYLTHPDQALDYDPIYKNMLNDIFARSDSRHIIGENITGARIAVYSQMIQACSMIL